MTVHLVYTTYAPDLRSKLRMRAGRGAQRFGASVGGLGARDRVDVNQWPASAPVSITAQVYTALRSRYKTLLYDWQERILIRGGEGHVLIGHHVPGDPATVWNRSCREGDFAIRVVLAPLCYQNPQMFELEPYMAQVDAIFGIVGPYWYDTWQDSALAHWKAKITPLDMALDIARFPRVKQRFNPPGRRKFLYIGWNGALKGTHLLSLLFGMTQRHRCVWIGSGKDLRNVEHRPLAALTPEYVRRLADECDIFITLGVADANPTTVLECMAWGFPVCCTPQSGYCNMPEIIEMSTTDMRHNLDVLDRLQYAPEEEIQAQADAARCLVQRHYTWERFTGTVLGRLDWIARDKGLSGP